MSGYVRGSFSVCAGGIGRSIWYFGSQTESASDIGGIVETAGLCEECFPGCLTEAEVEQAVTSKSVAAAAGTRIRNYRTQLSWGAGIST